MRPAIRLMFMVTSPDKARCKDADPAVDICPAHVALRFSQMHELHPPSEVHFMSRSRRHFHRHRFLNPATAKHTVTVI